jgi:hypothetical protein
MRALRCPTRPRRWISRSRAVSESEGKELVRYLKRSVNEALAAARYDAYRRALRHAGYTPGSVELAVAQDAAWLEGSDGEPR